MSDKIAYVIYSLFCFFEGVKRDTERDSRINIESYAVSNCRHVNIAFIHSFFFVSGEHVAECLRGIIILLSISSGDIIVLQHCVCGDLYQVMDCIDFVSPWST